MKSVMESNRFTPLTHEDLELKRSLISYARKLKSKAGLENQLASSFIYASFTEYAAWHLLKSLRYFTFEGTYIKYRGSLFMDERDRGDVGKETLGKINAELDRFNFPRKSSIHKLVKEINEARNNLFHNFAKSDSKGLDNLLSKDLVEIQDKTESLLREMDGVYKDLRIVLDKYVYAQVDFNTVTMPASNTIIPQANITVWQNVICVSNNPVNFLHLRIKKFGTLKDRLIGNFRLFIDSQDHIAECKSIDNSSYVVFDLTRLQRILLTGNRTIKITADIVRGAKGDFGFSLENPSDVSLIDSVLGTMVLPTTNQLSFSPRRSGSQHVGS